MGVFAKLAGLAVALGGGSLLAAWLTFVVQNVPLAALTLVATGGLAVGWIVLIIRAERVQR